MAEWNLNPSWANITSINNGQRVTFNDGFYASDQNKIVENLQYLFNSVHNIPFAIGNITTNTLLPGQPAYVNVTMRETEGIKYLDFVFNIPKGDKGAQGFTGPQGPPGKFAAYTAGENIKITPEHIISAQVKMFNPITGVFGTVQNAIASLFSFFGNGITALAFDTLELTVQVFEEKELTANQFDTNGNALL